MRQAVIWIACFACSCSQPDLPAAHSYRDRRAFAEAMGRVTPGMPEEQVAAILGKPDDIRTDRDPGGISTARTREIWCYGTDGHLTFPTLGRIYIDFEGNAQYVFGGNGHPPDASIFREDELSGVLRIIDRTSDCEGCRYDPLSVIQTVNALQALGKDKAFAAIDEYLRVSSLPHSKAREGLFLVLRVLFEIPEDPGHMPPMLLGLPNPDPPRDPKRIPRFPIALIDDIPILLIGGYGLQGRAQDIKVHVKYFRKSGLFRTRPLNPPERPFDSVKSLEKSPEWPHLKGDAWEDHGRAMMRNQILRLVASVYRLEADVYGSWISPDGEADTRWAKLKTEFSQVGAKWDGGMCRYVFKDGTSLPDERKIYFREIWELRGIGNDAELILERDSPKYVTVHLQQSGGDLAAFRPWSLRIFRVKDKEKSLVEFPGRGQGPVYTSPLGSNTSSNESRSMTVLEGEDLQAELIVDSKSRLSPVLKP